MGSKYKVRVVDIKKLRIQAGTTGHNVSLLLKLPKVFVLDKWVQDKEKIT